MENEIKTTHLREETLKDNKSDCMICLKKHPIKSKSDHLKPRPQWRL